jgi:regulator of RNase E activity RraA
MNSLLPTDLTTANLADACQRLGIEQRSISLSPLLPRKRIDGPALPVVHYGSVDVFLEAIEGAPAGCVMVIDNGGRSDEACIGDLVALEAMMAGFSGLAVWGYHRDSVEIKALPFQVFSLGSMPFGPRRLDPRVAGRIALLGDHPVTADDYVVADDDGVLLLPRSRLDELQKTATEIREVELRQAEIAKGPQSLREQLKLREYLDARDENPDLTFREHLAKLGGAIEVKVKR